MSDIKEFMEKYPAECRFLLECGELRGERKARERARKAVKTMLAQRSPYRPS